MTLKLYNTLTRRKEEFQPLDPKNVRLYVCGPTVYDHAHIGNARPIIVFDVLFRLLRHLYGAEHVAYVRNITDVDDKINARAREEGVSIRELTNRTTEQFHQDISALGVLPPTHEPRATEHLAEMRSLIERLIERGVAYVAEDHVLFSPSEMNKRNEPPYGALSRRPLDEMLAGARVDVASYKRDEMDFVLWKPSKEGEPGWHSPAGIEIPGRPGWHIECSAMAMAKLLEPYGGGLHTNDPKLNVFDIHGGGIDLVFPHHENEIAQSCCALGTESMANIWMHNGFLQVEGQKMSKSLGNFVTMRDVLELGLPGDVIRWAMLKTNYREPINWTSAAFREASAILDGWNGSAAGAERGGALSEPFLGALCDDLNTHEAFGEMTRLRKRVEAGDPEAQRQLAAAVDFFGFSEIERWRALHEQMQAEEKAIASMLAARSAARASRNWVESDRIRDDLAAMGIAIKDNKDGTTTWEIKQ